MADTLETLSGRLNARAAQLRAGVTEMVKVGARAADAAAVRSTPADTGQARSNWITTIDEPFDGTILPYAPGKKLGMGETENADAAIAQGDRVIATFDSTHDRSVIIQNNLDYIQGLNDGSISKQSANMVEIGAQAAVNAMRTVKIFK